MRTTYVRNVPEELYRALRKRSRERGTSVAEVVRTILRECVPTARELRRRREWYRRLEKLRASPSPAKSPFPSTEEMLREDRAR
jgi:plasmid stability protein